MFISSADFDLQKIADSGQCFRMYNIGNGRFRIIARDRVLYLEQKDGGVLLSCNDGEFSAFWEKYFDLSNDYEHFRKSIDESDLYLTKAAEFGRGIRILEQDPWEMLITFIISQRKNIPAIQKSVEMLCAKCGKPIVSDGEILFAFPTPRALAFLSDEELRACSLGYRAPYVHAAAAMVTDGSLDLDSLRELCDEELLSVLQTVPGVGPKVANCVLLFGYHRLGAFPIDVWIKRVLDTEYNGAFPLERYTGFGGVIQQYMFFYARSEDYKKHPAKL